jgi:hypothetical protein
MHCIWVCLEAELDHVLYLGLFGGGFGPCIVSGFVRRRTRTMHCIWVCLEADLDHVLYLGLLGGGLGPCIVSGFI